MLTIANFQEELMRLVKRGQDASLAPSEMADAMQAEMDELDAIAGDCVRSGLIDVPEGKNQQSAG